MCKQPTQRARAGHPSPGLTPMIPPQQRGFAGASGAEQGWAGGAVCVRGGGGGRSAGKGALAESPSDPGVGVSPPSPQRPPRLHTPARAEAGEAPGWLLVATLGTATRTLSKYLLSLVLNGPGGPGPKHSGTQASIISPP